VILLDAERTGAGLFRNLAPELVHTVTSPEDAVQMIKNLL
jgi:hypothetical protein